MKERTEALKLAFICPTKFIESVGNQGDFHLALSHLIDLDSANEYEHQLVKSKKEIYLDNGCFENGTPEDIHTLIEKAIRIRASYFFAPDILFDAKKNKAELLKTIEIFNKTKQEVRNRFERTLGLAAVVQADNKEEYIRQLLEFNYNDDVDMIGLSILSIPKSFGESITESRMELLRTMYALDKRGVVWKKMHLLGLGNSYEDVLFANRWCPWIVSNDTSSAFWNGYHERTIEGVRLEVERGKIESKIDFNVATVTDRQKEIIQQNIDRIKYALTTRDVEDAYVN